MAIRLAIGTASLTGGSVVGLGSTTTAGTALSFLATSGVVWSIDYGLNELDALLHRDLLTAQVSVALANAMRREEDQADVGAARQDPGCVCHAGRLYRFASRPNGRVRDERL